MRVAFWRSKSRQLMWPRLDLGHALTEKSHVVVFANQVAPPLCLLLRRYQLLQLVLAGRKLTFALDTHTRRHFVLLGALHMLEQTPQVPYPALEVAN